jgi:hypothetical protein
VQGATREHLFKNCLRWTPQQKILWAEVRRQTGRGKNRFKIRDLFADERCTRSVLDFLRTTEVGRRIGPKDDEPGQGAEKTRGRTAEVGQGAVWEKNSFSLSSFPLSLLCKGWARRGQGESPRAACGLTEVGVGRRTGSIGLYITSP